MNSRQETITPGFIQWDLKGHDKAIPLALMGVHASGSLSLAASLICSLLSSINLLSFFAHDLSAPTK